MTIRHNLTINPNRLWDSLMEMATIGGTPKGGCNRQALTGEDAQGRALFTRWCQAAGATIRMDEMGSLFARYEGQEDLPPILIGSHLDTQPTGGKFDGVLGVLAGVEILRVLHESGIRPHRPIEVVNWTNEEGCRFAPAMMASAVYAGVLDPATARAAQDQAGIRFGDALDALPALPGVAPMAITPARAIHAYLELHIEQGPILEAEGVDVGIVTGGQGIRWYDVSLTGFESHAGSTPMPRRRDALVGAARLITAIQQIGRDFAPNGVATVGQMAVSPNSRNVIPGLVQFTVDMRHPDAAALTRMDASLRDALAQMSTEEKLDHTPSIRLYAHLCGKRRRRWG
jgi:beta-ureidopropionase / N-carbamoyl-L-amino-acid hydrolase